MVAQSGRKDQPDSLATASAVSIANAGETVKVEVARKGGVHKTLDVRAVIAAETLCRSGGESVAVIGCGGVGTAAVGYLDQLVHDRAVGGAEFAGLLAFGLQHEQRAQLRVAVLLDDEHVLVRGDEIGDRVVERECADPQPVEMDEIARRAMSEIRIADQPVGVRLGGVADDQLPAGVHMITESLP